MKARAVILTSDPERVLRALEPDQTIPEGFEEVELVIESTELEPSFRGTRLVQADVTDPCECGEPRRKHARYSAECLVLDCHCTRFREAR